ncbi:Asp-tRNA(Asn)/Glu-tRNA(Gln) amidotransferase subunit GatC [Desulfurispira natronophila]|uniref:Aspartyl/glutamyl-tRNA(Asn/Gln) amidotransferase subunit C n=1 Tax=Desulfurispira natronophila TaxID=682562 RepID=A0A7W8DGD0_9BACT|nr:Asp-tRNA(Asn)/Glu-tRNA(Gln) amidotransferase subunit GatC [Desulfurispira natronophila]MBB5021108.1 aspartyl-tRNA(Asn)/glutamyl-tRNA(Gln) amidotransferase subunit C [Desulfurispira natronophila]
MKITQDEVLHIAKLSRLALSTEEVEMYQQDLSSILGYMDTLNSLDTRDVTATSHAVASAAFLREDTVTPSLPMEKVLRNAPDQDMDHFRVPPVIE